jgi:hypothetical protein
MGWKWIDEMEMERGNEKINEKRGLMIYDIN